MRSKRNRVRIRARLFAESGNESQMLAQLAHHGDVIYSRKIEKRCIEAGYIFSNDFVIDACAREREEEKERRPTER